MTAEERLMESFRAEEWLKRTVRRLEPDAYGLNISHQFAHAAIELLWSAHLEVVQAQGTLLRNG